MVSIAVVYYYPVFKRNRFLWVAAQAISPVAAQYRGLSSVCLSSITLVRLA